MSKKYSDTLNVSYSSVIFSKCKHGAELGVVTKFGDVEMTPDMAGSAGFLESSDG